MVSLSTSTSPHSYLKHNRQALFLSLHWNSLTEVTNDNQLAKFHISPHHMYAPSSMFMVAHNFINETFSSHFPDSSYVMEIPHQVVYFPDLALLE